VCNPPVTRSPSFRLRGASQARAEGRRCMEGGVEGERLPGRRRGRLRLRLGRRVDVEEIEEAVEEYLREAASL